MILVKGVSKLYKNEKVIKYKDYTFENGKSYIILGASGSGKSTLLNMISGLLSFDSGEIYFDNLAISTLKQKEIDKMRIEKIGYIFQDFKLLNEMTVKDNIELLKLEHVDTSLMDYLLDKLSIKGKKNKKIKNLSGGEKQRVAIARALVKEPQVILADEPTGNLNYEIGVDVIKCLTDMSKGKTLIVVSHDDRLTKYFDVVIHMEDLIIKEVTPND